MLLTEFDDNRQAIINPQDLHQPIEGFPKVVISCFSRVTFARLLENYDHEVIARTSMANFEVVVYGITIGDQQIGAFNAPVGAASCVGIIEDLIQFGMEKLVLFGTCGVWTKILRRPPSSFQQQLFETKGPATTIFRLVMKWK